VPITHTSIISTESSADVSIPWKSYLVSAKEWQEILPRFADASVYQTTEYGRYVSGGKNLEHFVLEKNENIRAATLVRIITVPIIHRRIAYVYWGPLWQCGENNELLNLELALVALRQEYVEKRHMLLHIFPNLTGDSENNYREMFQSAGFKFVPGGKKERTFLLDLSHDLEEIRRNLRRNWRNHLNKALKNNLEVVSGNQDELFDIFIEIYQELLKRKKFTDSPDIFTWREIQKQLPERFKMKVFVCKADREPVSAAVGTVLGNKGIYLLGATSKKGMKTQGSYLIQWEMIRWLKELGCRWYDLGGIDPQKNPGVFHFKEGMGGEEIQYIGQYEVYQGWRNGLISHLSELWQKRKKG